METLEKKFEKYFAEHRERERLVAKLSEATSDENIELWEVQRQTFERDRIQNPKVADEFFKQDLTQGQYLLEITLKQNN